MKTATCHPERPSRARGLCSMCAQRTPEARAQQRAWTQKRLAADPAYRLRRNAQARQWRTRNRELCLERLRARYASGKYRPPIWEKRKHSSILCQSKKCNLPFDLTVVWLKRQRETTPVCPVLGMPLEYGPHHRNSPNGASVDRIVPHRGYLQQNCRVISFQANVLKNNATPAELKALAADAERNVA